MARRLSSPVLIILCAAFLLRGAVSSSFSPECTLPPPDTSYVSGSNVRSTLSILWNCLSIIILCTWNIQHLNIPAVRPPTRSWIGELRFTIPEIWRKIKWMILTVLIPEYLAGKALAEWAATIEAHDTVEGWDKVHTYMANMGYFVVDWGKMFKISPTGEIEDWREAREPQEKNSKDIVRATELDDSIQALPDGNDSLANREESQLATNDATYNVGDEINYILSEERDFSESSELNLKALRYRYWALSALQWRDLTERFDIEAPLMNSSQLKSLDRGGVLVKTFALVQVSYLVVQLIARKVHGLPSAQLEIAALAFAASSAVTYLLYWNRPQGVETIHVVTPESRPSKDIIRGLLRELAISGPIYSWTSHRIEIFDPHIGPAPIRNHSNPVKNKLFGFGDDVIGYNYEIFFLGVGALVGGTLFGGLHCLAWNFKFPTAGEALGWRVCSVATTCLPIVSLVPATVWLAMVPAIGRRRGSPIARMLVASVGIGLFLIPYILARLFLLVETVRSLFFLPPEAFVETWSESFPHVG